jgi:hypothetical protein
MSDTLIGRRGNYIVKKKMNILKKLKRRKPKESKYKNRWGIRCTMQCEE